MVNFFRERSHLRGAPGSHRSQQRKHRVFPLARDHHFEAVAVDPAVMFGVAPRRLAIHTPGKLPLFLFVLVPRTTSGGNQALVHRGLAGVDDLLIDRLLPLQLDGLRKEPMTASIPTEKRAPRGKLLFSGDVSNLALVYAVCYKAKLRRLGLLSFQHSHHNQHSDEPVRNDRLCSRPCSRTLPLGFPQKRHRQLDQRFQRRAGLGTSSHPWALLRRLVSSWQKKHKRPEALGFSSIQFPDTLKQSLGPRRKRGLPQSGAPPPHDRRSRACRRSNLLSREASGKRLRVIDEDGHFNGRPAPTFFGSWATGDSSSRAALTSRRRRLARPQTARSHSGGRQRPGVGPKDCGSRSVPS